MNIGKKIKELRSTLSLTQEELAKRCDLTKGYISQLENDLTSPSITTLVDILSALGTSLKEFFSDDENQKIVYKKDDYITKDVNNFSITWLVNNAQKNEMEPIIVSINPKCKTEEDLPHEGQEFGYVLEGEIVVCFDNHNHRVHKGETFYYIADKVHYLYNPLNKVSKVIWISSPPNF